MTGKVDVGALVRRPHEGFAHASCRQGHRDAADVAGELPGTGSGAVQQLTRQLGGDVTQKRD